MSPPRPLKVDFGFFVTLGAAARVYARTFFRTAAWALFSFVSALVVCALPFGLGYVNYHRYGGDTWQGLFAGSVAVLSMLAFHVLSTFVLSPSGSVVLCDQTMREEQGGFGESLGRAAAAVAVNAGSLALLFLVYVLLLALFLLPGLVLFYLLYERSPAGALLALFGFGAIGTLFLLATSLLALPALLLEERGASHALVRSWELSRPGFGALAAMAGVFICALGLLPLPFKLLGSNLLAALTYEGVVLFLPALMAAAYHGLAAEDARLLGRG